MQVRWGMVLRHCGEEKEVGLGPRWQCWDSRACDSLPLPLCLGSFTEGPHEVGL